MHFVSTLQRKKILARFFQGEKFSDIFVTQRRSRVSQTLAKKVVNFSKENQISSIIRKIGPSGAQYYFCFNLYFLETKNSLIKESYLEYQYTLV